MELPAWIHDDMVTCMEHAYMAKIISRGEMSVRVYESAFILCFGLLVRILKSLPIHITDYYLPEGCFKAALWQCCKFNNKFALVICYESN